MQISVNVISQLIILVVVDKRKENEFIEYY